MNDEIQSIRQMLIGPLAEELERARPALPRHLRKQFVEMVEEYFGEDLRNKHVRSQFTAIVKEIGSHWSKSEDRNDG